MSTLSPMCDNVIHRKLFGMTLINGISIIKEYAQNLPSAPGVYRMLGEGGKVLYVGKARNLAKRVISYTHAERLPYRLQQMIAQTLSMEVVITQSEAEALLLEANLIKQFSPRYNILLKDDKSFPYIMIPRDHPYPQIAKHRGERKRKADYYGPFASAGDVNETLAYLQRVFLLRPCSDTVFAQRTRPCLEYQIKRCSAPCVKKISQAAYAELLEEAKDFLNGKNQKLQKKLALLMEEASQDMDYEQAAIYRDRIKALTQIQAKQHIHVAAEMDADIMGLYREGGECCIQLVFFRGGRHLGNQPFFPTQIEDASDQEILASFIPQFYRTATPPAQLLLSHSLEEPEAFEEALSSLAGRKVTLLHPQRGEKTELVAMAVQNAKEALIRKLADKHHHKTTLENLATQFGLDHVPKRIEVYDNSHIMGTHEVGAMVVAGQEGFIKSAYRRFTIRTTGKDAIQHGDDYAMMREVFTRRFLKLKNTDPEKHTGAWPDIVLIDGGKGQLSVVTKVFEDLGVSDVVAIAIAKGPDRNAGHETFYMVDRAPFSLKKNDKLLYYFQKLRDEAHRFAIGSHRTKRKNTLVHSQLDDIPGIGPAKKKALLSHFGSVKAISNASVEDLCNVEGINKSLAEEVYQSFRG